MTTTPETTESKQTMKVGRKTFTIEKRVNASGAYIQLTESGRDRLKIPLEDGYDMLLDAMTRPLCYNPDGTLKPFTQTKGH